MCSLTIVFSYAAYTLVCHVTFSNVRVHKVDNSDVAADFAKIECVLLLTRSLYYT